MVFCPQCELRIDGDRSLAPHNACPSWGEKLDSGSFVDWSDVVRVANLAEAGFIADELIGLGIEARIYQLEEFTAANDRWTSQYLIRVPNELALSAADHVRQYLNEETPGRRTILDSFRLATEGATEHAAWTPLVVVIIAGVVGFAFGQRFPEQKVPRSPTPNALATAVDGIGRPLSSAPAANQPRFRLSFDRRQQQWTLDTDRDNDGVFDCTQRFTSTGSLR
ncbi:MAG: hypothetical protein IT427_03560 [Pirellulales bacterium]|nr:hypothetical protein [Pirellulales bacterium]